MTISEGSNFLNTVGIQGNLGALVFHVEDGGAVHNTANGGEIAILEQESPTTNTSVFANVATTGSYDDLVKKASVDGVTITGTGTVVDPFVVQGGSGGVGPKGDKGDTGNTGADGLSAYEIYVSTNPNPILSEVNWLASLVGQKGDKGDTGNQGTTGDTGLSAYEVYLTTNPDPVLSESQWMLRKPRVLSLAVDGSVEIDTNSYDASLLIIQSNTLITTIGEPVDFDSLTIRMIGELGPFSITWGPTFLPSVSLPTTVESTGFTFVEFYYDAMNAIWTLKNIKGDKGDQGPQGDPGSLAGQADAIALIAEADYGTSSVVAAKVNELITALQNCGLMLPMP